MEKRGFVFGTCLLMGVLIFTGSVRAATINASSCSQTDVQAAIYSANKGGLWKASGSVTMPDLMESIRLWKWGCI